MEKIFIITESKNIEIEKHPKDGYIIKQTDSAQQMHWSYLLCGGFVIGMLSLIFISSLWLLSFRERQKLMLELSPEDFIKKYWGYW